MNDPLYVDLPECLLEESMLRPIGECSFTKFQAESNETERDGTENERELSIIEDDVCSFDYSSSIYDTTSAQELSLIKESTISMTPEHHGFDELCMLSYEYLVSDYPSFGRAIAPSVYDYYTHMLLYFRTLQFTSNLSVEQLELFKILDLDICVAPNSIAAYLNGIGHLDGTPCRYPNFIMRTSHDGIYGFYDDAHLYTKFSSIGLVTARMLADFKMCQDFDFVTDISTRKAPPCKEQVTWFHSHVRKQHAFSVYEAAPIHLILFSAICYELRKLSIKLQHLDLSLKGSIGQKVITSGKDLLGGYVFDHIPQAIYMNGAIFKYFHVEKFDKRIDRKFRRWNSVKFINLDYRHRLRALVSRDLLPLL